LTASRAIARDIADSLLSVLLAPTCAACQRLLEHPIHGCICAACWSTVIRIAPPLCDRCGDPLPSSSVDLCRRCRRNTRAIDRGRAAGLYEGSLRAIVHAFKYEGRRSLAAPLGALMRRAAGDVLNDVACVVPVPLHWRRARQRGFNQAADLARTLGPPVLHALRRTRATRPQADLPAARRHKNVGDAFALARRVNANTLSGACVLLVDDVSTTGATLDACARVLKAAGVREVRALTAAKVATPRSP
jgi:ComF family protein